MIHITCIPSVDNIVSSGHIFWEIFTTFIFCMFIDAQPVWDDTWTLTAIITDQSLKNNTANRLTEYDHEININDYRAWRSLSYNNFLEICNKINTAANKYNNILVTLSNVCAVHPDIICNWYKSKFISSNIYVLKLRPQLQKLYFSDCCNEQLDIFAIHIRRGDLVQWCYNMGYTINYYRNIINIINTYLNIPIHIYCEHGFTVRDIYSDPTPLKKFNYNDIMILETLKNVKIIKGKPTGTDFDLHFNALCRSKILMPSPSSFSLWAGFITNGIVLIDIKHIVSRPNIFRHCQDVPNFIVFNNFEDKIKELKMILNGKLRIVQFKPGQSECISPALLISSVPSAPSAPSEPSAPSAPSPPSAPSTLPSEPSEPSEPSAPSEPPSEPSEPPSAPSEPPSAPPSAPPAPSTPPSEPSAPSEPSILSVKPDLFQMNNNNRSRRRFINLINTIV